MRRILAGGVAVAFVFTLAFMAPAAQATPAPQSTQCHLASTATFNPGLQLSQEQKVKIKVKGKLSSCSGGGVTGAKLKGKGGGSISCTSGTASVKLTAKWNTGETSKVTLTVDLGTQSLSGMVTSGKFSGETVSATNVSLSPITGDCLTSPLTKAEVDADLGL